MLREIDINREGRHLSVAPLHIILSLDYNTPCANIASATLMKPATFAPFT